MIVQRNPTEGELLKEANIEFLLMQKVRKNILSVYKETVFKREEIQLKNKVKNNIFSEKIIVSLLWV